MFIVRKWCLNEKTGRKLWEREQKIENKTFDELKEMYLSYEYLEFGKSYEGIDLLMYKPTEWDRTLFVALIKGD